jgi:hypothetical protein
MLLVLLAVYHGSGGGIIVGVSRLKDQGGRMTSRRYATALMITLGLIAAACGDGTDPEALPTLPTQVPTTVPSELPTALEPAVASLCENLDELTSTLDEIASGSIDLSEEATSRLESLASDLRANAAELEAAGQQQVAAVAEAVALALGALQGILAQNPELDEDARAAIDTATASLNALPQDLCATG